MSVSSLPLSEILNVAVVVSPAAAPGPAFNQALIVGSSNVIPSVGSNSRVQQFTSLTGMLTASPPFTTTDPEYLAAEVRRHTNDSIANSIPGLNWAYYTLASRI